VIQNESEPERTTVMVQNQLVTLPHWMVEVASKRGVNKAIALLGKYRGITRFHVANSNIVANIKGSKGDTYLVKVSIWNGDNGDQPALLTCSCPHGTFGGKGFCYHKIALIFKVLLLPAMPVSNPIPKYEDDFELDKGAGFL